MRQVLELLLLWPQGKEGAGRERVQEGGIVSYKEVRWLEKTRRRKNLIEKKEERTKEKVRLRT